MDRYDRIFKAGPVSADSSRWWTPCWIRESYNSFNEKFCCGICQWHLQYPAENRYIVHVHYRLDVSKERFRSNIRIQSKQYPEIKRFMKIPGVGLIHAATISAIIETPHRFANKKKLWMYAGIGLMERRSGEKVYSRKLTREYNRPLKNAIKQAVESSIFANDNQFRRQYLRLTLENRIASHKAKLTVARSSLAALYGMWKKREEYDPDIDVKRRERKKT